MNFRQFAFAAGCLAALSAPAYADTQVTVLHVSDNAAQKAIWDEIAKDYNAAHPGVNVQFKYLENEAFKAKLPTMLQADESRPDLFYSWGGGVMQAQDKAGFLKDITKDVASWESDLSPTAVDAFKVDGKVVGVPFEVGEVAFYYNKKLFEKAGVKAEDIKSWDDFLGAVKKLKAAGITPLVVGAGEKWPMHFYYSYLVMRIGGEHALADAKAVLRRYGIAASPSVQALLDDGESETPKPGDPAFVRSETRIIAAPQASLMAAAEVAGRAGYRPLILGDALEGEAKEVGKVMAGIARQVAIHGQPVPAPCVLISGGETTVTVAGAGRGGRNVEFLLALAVELDGRPRIYAIAGDTDGADGAEEVAGAIVTPDSLERARGLGFNARTLLADNDAHTFFRALGDQVITGPTLTNVNDFRAILVNAC